MDSAFMNSKASSFLNFVTIRQKVIQLTFFPTNKVDLFLFVDQWPWRPVHILSTTTNVFFLVFSFLVNTQIIVDKSLIVLWTVGFWSTVF